MNDTGQDKYTDKNIKMIADLTTVKSGKTQIVPDITVIVYQSIITDNIMVYYNCRNYASKHCQIDLNWILKHILKLSYKTQRPKVYKIFETKFLLY